MEIVKYYTLYTDKQQTKLLAAVPSLEEVKSESEYYTAGVWFEYDQKVGSSLLFNEKVLTGVTFPKEAKKREVSKYDSDFKWIT